MKFFIFTFTVFFFSLLRSMHSSIHSSKEILKEIMKMKDLLSRMHDRTKQTIDQLEDLSSGIPVCILFQEEQKSKHNTRAPRTFYLYMAKLKKAFAFFLQNPTFASRQKIKVLIVRDIAMGNKIQKKMEVYTGFNISENVVKDIWKVKFEKTNCGPKKGYTNFSLYQFLLRIYRTLRRNSKLLLNNRFVTNYKKYNKKDCQ